MATIGYNPASFNGFLSRGINQENQLWNTGPYSTSIPIVLTTLHAYFGTYTGGTATCAICVWDASGNLLGSANVSVPQTGSGAGVQQWNAVSSSIVVPAGNFYMGFWVPESSGFNTSMSSSFTTYDKSTGGGISNLSGGTNTTLGGIGVYADYVPAGALVWNGSSWVNGTAYVWNGTSWVAATVSVWNGTSWVAAT